MWLIFIVTIFSFLIFVVFKVWIEKSIKAEWLKITIEAFIIFLFIPLCFYFIASHLQDNKNKGVQAVNEKFQQTPLKTVSSDTANTEQLDEQIKPIHKEIFLSSTEDAKKFVKNLLADLDTRNNELQGLSNNSSELVNKLNLKWKPFFNFVIAAFDDRINELNKYDDRINYTKSGRVPIVYDVGLEKYTSAGLRKFEMEGKTLFRIIYDPGQVREGLCIKELVMTIYEGDDQAFKFHFTKNGVILDPDYKKYRMHVQSTINDPIEDVKLRKKTIEAINLLISSSYIR
ncbi:MAG: hypothetical protein PVI72_13940 [Desulfobacterales bacterium]|jgi:hypothetical protein